MKWQNLKPETKDLVANAIGIYNALRQRDKLYREESVISLSLYGGVLRMGKTYEIKHIEKRGGVLLAGLPLEQRPEYDSSTYEVQSTTYNNVVCQILNEHGITIERLVKLLNLDSRLLCPVSEMANPKLEDRYNMVYRNLLSTIRSYYVESLIIAENKRYSPEIDMTIPNIISALHYPNIDSNETILSLNKALETSGDSILTDIEAHSTYNEAMCRTDRKTGRIKEIYQIKKPLHMNPHIGRIL